MLNNSVSNCLIGTMNPGLPPFKPPSFSTTIQDETLTFSDMVSRLSTSLVVFPMIAILEIVAVSKTFCNCNLYYYCCHNIPEYKLQRRN